MAAGEHTQRVLVHYGIKGMRWGVRRDPAEATTVVTPGRKVKAQGGYGQQASEDAINAAKAHRTARKSTTDALSNKELQALVNRMQLEQQFAQLNANGPRASKGRKFLNMYMQEGGKDLTMNHIKEGHTELAKKAALLLPGSRAIQIGVDIGAQIARAYVRKYSGGGKNK